MQITTVSGFLDYYERVRERTLNLIHVVQPEHLDWCYKPGKYSIGDMIRHIGALERYMFAENVCGRQSAYHGCGKEIVDVMMKYLHGSTRCTGSLWKYSNRCRTKTCSENALRPAVLK